MEVALKEDVPADELLITLDVIRVHSLTSASSRGLLKSPGSMRGASSGDEDASLIEPRDEGETRILYMVKHEPPGF
jgi:hypothetical protein